MTAPARTRSVLAIAILVFAAGLTWILWPIDEVVPSAPSDGPPPLGTDSERLPPPLDPADPPPHHEAEPTAPRSTVDLALDQDRAKIGFDILVLRARDGVPMPDVTVEFASDPYPTDPTAAYDFSHVHERTVTDARGLATGASGRPWFYARARAQDDDGTLLEGQVRVYASPPGAERDSEERVEIGGPATTLWLQRLPEPLRLRVVDGIGRPVPFAPLVWSAHWNERPKIRARFSGEIGETDGDGRVLWYGYARLLEKWAGGDPLTPDAAPMPETLAIAVHDVGGAQGTSITLKELPAPNQRVVLRCPAAGAIELAAFDAAGKPLPGAFQVTVLARGRLQDGADTESWTRRGARSRLENGHAVVPLLATDDDPDVQLHVQLADVSGRVLLTEPCASPTSARPRVGAVLRLRGDATREVVRLRLYDLDDQPLPGVVFGVHWVGGPSQIDQPDGDWNPTSETVWIRTDEDGIAITAIDRFASVPDHAALFPSNATGSEAEVPLLDAWRAAVEGGTEGDGIVDLGEFRLPVRRRQ